MTAVPRYNCPSRVSPWIIAISIYLGPLKQLQFQYDALITEFNIFLCLKSKQYGIKLSPLKYESVALIFHCECTSRIKEYLGVWTNRAYDFDRSIRREPISNNLVGFIGGSANALYFKGNGSVGRVVVRIVMNYLTFISLPINWLNVDRRCRCLVPRPRCTPFRFVSQLK